jgi:hypothetical protein
MTFLNESDCDRAIRMLAGILFVAAGWGLTVGLAGTVLISFGAIALGTSIVGWCPLYALFRFSTGTRVRADACPACDADQRR